MERFDSIERRQRLANFFFGIFSRRVKWGDVAVAESCPIHGARCGFQRAHLAMKIYQAELLAKRFIFFERLVISRQRPDTFAERLQDFAATIEPLAEIR